MSTQLLLCDVSGPLKDLTEKLSGDNQVMWLGALKKLLRDGPVAPHHVDLCTLRIGRAIDLYNTLLKSGVRFSDSAGEMMFEPGLVQISKTDREVALTAYSVLELIPNSRSTQKQLCARSV